MQLLTTSKFLLSTTALFMLAACATSDNGNGNGDNGNGDNGNGNGNGNGEVTSEVTTGTTDGEMSSNGLRFADHRGFDMGDLTGRRDNGSTLTLRAAKLVATGDGTEYETVSAKLVDVEATIFKKEDGDWAATVDLGDGELLFIDYWDGNYTCGDVSSTGNEYCSGWNYAGGTVYAVIFDSDNDPNDYEGEDWTRSLVATFVGLETDPDFLPFKGEATYYGGFGIELVSLDHDFDAETYGDIELTADFVESTIIDGTLYGDGFDVEFAGEIAGNGWTATDTDVAIIGDMEMTEGGEIQLDGVFYGTTANATAGTILVNAEVSDGEDTIDVTGIGAFVADEGWGD